MANSLLKLTVESSEYDAKLKKAAEGIRHLADVAHKSGGDLTGLEKAELDFIKALGDMETKSRSAAGQVRELESTYKELKVIYEQLNEVEKADEGGKALAASLEQLKQRAQDAKKSLEDASKSLQENADAGKEDSSVLAQLASKFTINIDAIKLFNVGLQAAKAALDVAKDAFFASETNVDEWGRTMAASQSLYEGFLTAINNGDISGYLSRMDEIVQAARAAYNELDTLGTMKTIQAPKMSAQQTENERLRMMIQTGRYIAPVDGRKASMKDGQLLTPEQIKTLERQLQNGMKSVVKLVGNEVKQTGKAINAYYNSIAKQNGMSLQEFKKGTSSWDEFSKKMQGYQQYQKWRQENSFTDMYGNRQVREGNPYQEFKKWGTFRVDKMGDNSYNDLVRLIQQRDQQAAQAYGMQSQAYRTMNRAEGVTVRQLMGGGSGGGGGKTTTTTGIKDEFTDMEELVGLIPVAEQKVKDLQQQIRESWDQNEIATLRKQLKEAQNDLDVLQGKLPKDSVVELTITANDTDALQKVKDIDGVTIDPKTMTVTANTSEALQKVQELVADVDGKVVNVKVVPVLTDADIEKQLQKQYGKAIQVPITPKLTTGDEFEQSIRIKLSEQNVEADMQALRTMIEAQIKNGIEGVDIPSDWIAGQIFGEGVDIPDEYWRNLQEQINEKLREMNIEELNIDFGTGKDKGKDKKESDKKESKEEKKYLSEGLSQLSGGLGGLQNGFAQLGIDLGDGFGSVVSGLQGISTILMAIQTIITGIEAISALDAIIPFANGGVVHAANGYTVPGNHFSGDMVPALLNSGELVLNKAQQGNLASQLTGGAMQNMNLSAEIRGEQIRLVMNNNGRRTGRGEVVQTNRR